MTRRKRKGCRNAKAKPPPLRRCLSSSKAPAGPRASATRASVTRRLRETTGTAPEEERGHGVVVLVR